MGDKILAVWNGGSKASEALTEGGAGNKQFIVNGMGGDAAFAVYPYLLSAPMTVQISK